MATGCLIVGSDTAPVREVIKGSWNGILVDFFDSKKLAEKIGDVLGGTVRRSETLRKNMHNFSILSTEF
ncbi:hypothetical protein [Pseudomonas turukhanskensis]|uniref:hypothetical protein n=1 Tax=Pseudomonas turukhanskensis TaxID=1806536 RepID=UPI0022F32411|nr:hypothetical protein [Pseudomonas turukhanskensis]